MHPCAQAAATASIRRLNRKYVPGGEPPHLRYRTRMNKHERQGRRPADQQILSEDPFDERTAVPAQLVEISDAPPIAPPAPLTPGEVRTILMSLMLTMFLAALDQTIECG